MVSLMKKKTFLIFKFGIAKKKERDSLKKSENWQLRHSHGLSWKRTCLVRIVFKETGAGR